MDWREAGTRAIRYSHVARPPVCFHDLPRSPRDASGLFPLATSFCAEKDAPAIESVIQSRHLPYGAILDPMLPLPDL